jgi:hypothetical protein
MWLLQVVYTTEPQYLKLCQNAAHMLVVFYPNKHKQKSHQWLPPDKVKKWGATDTVRFQKFAAVVVPMQLALQELQAQAEMQRGIAQGMRRCLV